MIRILTYNIHKAIGNDRKYSLERIITILKKSQADIICLQEVDFLVPRSHNQDLANRIAEQLGYYYELGLNVYLKKGAYGNATFSKYPILHTENVNITWGIKKRRGCLMSKIQIPRDILFSPEKRIFHSNPDSRFLEIGILNLHFGLANFERLWQANQILDSAFVEIMRNHPLIILGDTNDRNEKIDEVFEKKGFFDTSKLYFYSRNMNKRDLYTFPSLTPRPLIRIDKIFVNHYWKVIKHRVLKTPLTKIASDHYPVYADLQLNHLSF